MVLGAPALAEAPALVEAPALASASVVVVDAALASALDAAVTV